MTFTQAAVEKLKPHPTKRRVIRDAASRSLFLIVQPRSGFKSWMMRFRRAGEGADKMVLGPADISHRRPVDQPVVGQPLNLIEARVLASQINAKRAAGVDVIAAHRARKHRQKIAIVEAQANSFSIAVKDFVEHCREHTRGWKSTAANLGLDANLNFKPNDGLVHRWGSRDIKQIDSSELHAAIEEARRVAVPGIPPKRDGVSESRARSLHATLSQLFSFLARRRRIEINPMASLHPPAVPKARDRVLSSVEIATVWKAFEAAKEPFTSALRLLLLTGCRLDEISSLQWHEVTEDGTMIVLGGDRTKNHRAFTIPLPPMGRDLVAAQARDGRYVFSTTGGLSPISSWSKAKERVDAAAGIATRWVLHDLRRTCATGMAEIGVPPHIVEAVLNHVSGAKAGVAGIYNRAAYAEEKKAALEKWAKHLHIVVGDKKTVAIRKVGP
jgi:integrase